MNYLIIPQSAKPLPPKELPVPQCAVYVAEFNNLVKIGRSEFMAFRYRSLKYSAKRYACAELGRVAVIGSSSPIAGEQYLHRIFADKRIFGTELFHIDFEEVLDIISGLDVSAFSVTKEDTYRKIREIQSISRSGKTKTVVIRRSEKGGLR